MIIWINFFLNKCESRKQNYHTYQTLDSSQSNTDAQIVDSRGNNVDQNFGMRMKPLEVAHYINSQFKMPTPPTAASRSLNTVGLPQPSSISNMSSNQISPSLSPAIQSSPNVGSNFTRDTKHPQQLWSRNKNGGLTYTGLFSSDC